MLILNVVITIQDTISISLSIPVDAQTVDSKICWHLASDPSKEGSTRSSWIVEQIVLLPIVPSTIEHILQFRLDTSCTADTSGNETSFTILAQFSKDQGRQWSMLHSLCLPASCSGAHSAIQSSWSSDEIVPWQRITLAMPWASVTEPVRIRFLQRGRTNKTLRIWALDDIHLSSCPHGCSGHGTCVVKDQCVCDEGYTGNHCQEVGVRLPTSLHENFESSRADMVINGMQISARCGSVSSGKAGVFNGPNGRHIVTGDLNTAASGADVVVKFVLKMSASTDVLCPGPDRRNESIYVHSSCNGGITWFLLAEIISTAEYYSSKVVELVVPHGAKGSSCRLKVWQPYHSGAGKDVWSIDDLYIGAQTGNYFVFDGSDTWPFFGRQQVLAAVRDYIINYYASLFVVLAHLSIGGVFLRP